jgi:hypothetical protein
LDRRNRRDLLFLIGDLGDLGGYGDLGDLGGYGDLGDLGDCGDLTSWLRPI